MAVQMSYYNESLAEWEPLLEPVIVEEEKTMWEVQLKVTSSSKPSRMHVRNRAGR